MADWSVLGCQVLFTRDTVRRGLQTDRRGTRCRTPVTDTARYGTSRLHPAAFLSDEAMREDRATALEVPVVNLWLLSRMGSPSLSWAVTERSAGGHTASLRTSSLAQSQAHDLHPSFEQPSRLRPRRVTSRGEIHLHLRSASVTSLTDRFFYRRPYRAPLGNPPRCLHVARYPLRLGRETSPLVSVTGREDTPSRRPVLLPRTRFLLLPGQQRYAVRVTTFREQSIQSPTGHPSSFHRRLPINTRTAGALFACNRSDRPACLAGKALLFFL